TFPTANVGTWPVTVNGLNLAGAAAGHYALSSDWAAGNATIQPRSASVTPSNNSKMAGTADPIPLTSGVLTNFMPSDGITATYSRLPGEAVGSYPIGATLNPAGALGNYAITYNTASFTINQKPTILTYTGAVTAYSGDCAVVVSAQLKEGVAP